MDNYDQENRQEDEQENDEQKKNGKVNDWLKILIGCLAFLLLLFLIISATRIAKEYKRLLEYRNDLGWWKARNKGSHDALFNMMKDCQPLFEQAKLTYWAHDGTLLGIMRHQDIIPWDDDIDLVVDKDQENFEQKIDDFKKLLEKNGYKLKTCQFGYKIFPSTYTTAAAALSTAKEGEGEGEGGKEKNGKNNKNSKDDNNYFMDLFTFSWEQINDNREDDRLVGNLPFRVSWPKSYYKRPDVYPLKTGTLGTLTIPIPNSSLVAVKRFYGEKVMTEVWIKYPHHRVDGETIWTTFARMFIQASIVPLANFKNTKLSPSEASESLIKK
jgi:hypothetical protein